MDLERKLAILADAAKYDASRASSGAARKGGGGGQGLGGHAWGRRRRASRGLTGAAKAAPDMENWAVETR